MLKQSITFFPVGNGDTSLIVLKDGTTIIIDCHIMDDGQYDVKSRLQDLLKKRDNIPFTDVFILTHPHNDHVQGFKNTFYVGDPAKYSSDDKKNGLIIVDELWFAPRIFTENNKDIVEDAKAFKKEAERRVALFKSGNKTRNDPGNRIRLIGATDNIDCEGLDDILTIPGKIVNKINGEEKENFRFFIMAPIKKDSDEDDNLNNTSIVMQARFDVDNVENAARILLGGDAESHVWERIVNKNTDEDLKWDLFLAPHHCSWTFFNENGDEPLESSLNLLEKKISNAYIVASSKLIKDDDDNPPSYKAKKLYVSSVGKDNFKCTAGDSESDTPIPLHFLITSQGVQPSDNTELKEKAFSILSKTVSVPRTYG